MKSMVDSFRDGQTIPHCQLQLIGPNQESLVHTIHLQGAKEPFNEMNMYIAAEGITR